MECIVPNIAINLGYNKDLTQFNGFWRKFFYNISETIVIIVGFYFASSMTKISHVTIFCIYLQGQQGSRYS